MQYSPKSLISSAGFSAVHTDHSSGVAASSEILHLCLTFTPCYPVCAGREPRRGLSPAAASRRQIGESILAALRSSRPSALLDRADGATTTFRRCTYIHTSASRRAVGVNIRPPFVSDLSVISRRSLRFVQLTAVDGGIFYEIVSQLLRCCQSRLYIARCGFFGDLLLVKRGSQILPKELCLPLFLLEIST